MHYSEFRTQNGVEASTQFGLVAFRHTDFAGVLGLLCLNWFFKNRLDKYLDFSVDSFGTGRNTAYARRVSICKVQCDSTKTISRVRY